MTPQPSSLSVVRVLLAAAWRRSVGRRAQARNIMRHRTAGRTAGWAGLGVFMLTLLMASANILAALTVRDAAVAGQRTIAEAGGELVVSGPYLRLVATGLAGGRDDRVEAERLVHERGGDPGDLADRLRRARQTGAEHLVSSRQATPGLASPAAFEGYPAMLATLALALWITMLIVQGEGPELDVQRRRHPMWEWLLSHPVGEAAVFAAEMLAPIAANPVFWSVPLVPSILYGTIYGPSLGILAALLVGVPVAIAAACAGKALEIGIVLRLTMRARGGATGLLGWFGYMAFALIFICWFANGSIATALEPPLRPFAPLPWPFPAIMLGYRGNGVFSFGAGVLACVAGSSLVIVGSVAVAVWSARQGLAAPPEMSPVVSSRFMTRPLRFGGDPLYRKELLWFARDRGALVQAVLIPLSVAGLQLFNFRDVLATEGGQWNVLSGAAILFGTYFLTVLGPRSLASEGPALWIALTWPRGLESLLKAKARLWTVLSSAIVALILAYAAWHDPANAAWVALVGVGWVLFAWSMAQKAVTLATVEGPSGEVTKVSFGRRSAVYLGALTFATGVQTLNWQVALAGIVYSTMSAAAMWQNFRAQLPFLYDPWSARLPPPPTLMHAMIAITLLVELGAVAGGIGQGIGGREWGSVVQAFGYGLAALGVATGMAMFLSSRDVPARAVWQWVSTSQKQAWIAEPGWRGLLAGLAMALLLGAGLGLLAQGYVALMREFEWARQLIDADTARMAVMPHMREAYVVLAVLFAPLAEEYLFRGLLHRALDREWGGWWAVIGSSAFFAIYHQPLAWLPVFTLGALSSVLFRKVGRLAPSVVLHMVYNAVLLT